MQNTWTEKNSWISMDDSQKKIYQNPTKQQAPALYDEVRVCVYCAQFFQKGQQDFYRVSDGFSLAMWDWLSHPLQSIGPRMS